PPPVRTSPPARLKLPCQFPPMDMSDRKVEHSGNIGCPAVDSNALGFALATWPSMRRRGIMDTWSQSRDSTAARRAYAQSTMTGTGQAARDCQLPRFRFLCQAMRKSIAAKDKALYSGPAEQREIPSEIQVSKSFSTLGGAVRWVDDLLGADDFSK